MNLHGSITELQNRISQLYLKLEQRFSENGLIRELWSAMAHDVAQQVKSLNALPPSFWDQIKKDQNKLFEAVNSARKSQTTEKKEDQSLLHCFDQALYVEEPTILKIYVPIIRRLRENWTNQALDFYIMVKAHLARITRVTESFSGDPLIIQRSNSLLLNFEKEVQEPHIVISHSVKKIQTRQPARPQKKAKKLPQRAPKNTRPMIKHAKIRHGRTKLLVNKINIRRRRAHR